MVEPFTLGSSWLTGGEYDTDSQSLTVFTRGGRDYTHTGVPANVVDEFKRSASPGQFYHSVIKGRY